MMRLITVVLITFVTNTFFSFVSGKDSLRQMRTIQITSIDTIKGYEKYYALPDEDLNDLFAAQIDSMVNSWYVQNAFIIDSVEITDADTHSLLPDSVYVQRLQNIDSYIDLSYNQTVKNFIALYTVKRRKQVEIMLGLANYYFPIFEEALDKYNLPMELKYLPIIESALNPAIRSRANAVGLWQFMYGTGRMYKLAINTFVDERCDPVKATDAAVKYLRDLYRIYQDWHLVIAAYNCGPGNVNKAIRRSGGARDYWTIYYRLPRETRGYVPAFIAAAYVMENYQNHNIQPRYPDFPIVTDTMKINDLLHFKQVSEILNIPIEELRVLNPQYRRDIIPAKKDKPYILKIPIEQVTAFIDNEQEIFNHKRGEFFPNNSIVTPKSRNFYHTVDIKGMDKLYYTVKSGDNLGYIAEWYKVRLSDLRYWNNVHRNLIRGGQKLVIYKPKGSAKTYANINSMSFAEKQRFTGRNRKPVTLSSSTPVTSYSDSEYEYYTVRRGDNLYDIARRYPGISNKDIIKVNGLNKSGHIFPGQKLKIPRKG
jgi:membrane-bound lytic murein transglycosylase D